MINFSRYHANYAYPTKQNVKHKKTVSLLLHICFSLSPLYFIPPFYLLFFRFIKHNSCGVTPTYNAHTREAWKIFRIVRKRAKNIMFRNINIRRVLQSSSNHLKSIWISCCSVTTVLFSLSHSHALFVRRMIQFEVGK